MTVTEPTTLSTSVCRLDQLVPERGVAALVDGRQVALFRVDDEGGARVFAIDHRDPFTGANVLARGIVGTTGHHLYVASPIHKQRFDLSTGACLDHPGTTLRTWRTAVVDGDVCIIR